MKHKRDLAGLTAFLLVSALLIWMVRVTLQRDVSGDTHSYSAVFSDVSGLRVGDDVRIAGVQVGRVDSIDILGPHVPKWTTGRLRVKGRGPRDTWG